ncbi:MAG: hypothetical protein GY853_09985 [PVC group bacterium]|nr:hypothetical protein [PVC group bacterium]
MKDTVYIRGVLIAMFILLLSSCAYTSKKTDKFVRLGESYEKLMPRVQRIAIIVDPCTGPMGVKKGTYYIVDESRRVGIYMPESAESFLKGKGYQVSYQLSPFVCACKKGSAGLKVAETRDAVLSSTAPPFDVSSVLAEDKEYEQALLEVIERIPATIAESKKGTKAVPISNGEIQRSLGIISERTGTETVLFIIAHIPETFFKNSRFIHISRKCRKIVATEN